MTRPVKSRHIMVLTGEPSGDLHGSRLVCEIKKLDPFVYISGIGGSRLENENVDLFFHISRLSAMGITEVLIQFRQIKHAFDLFKGKLRRYPPDLIILIDYPGFNLRAAQYAKARYNCPILYYITPKVWAWNKSRLKKIRACIDHAALIFPFEKKIYKTAGIPATYVGNPLLDEYPQHLTKVFLRKNRRNDEKHTLTIGLLPGSRKSEIDRLLGVMIQAAVFIKKKRTVRFIISKADSIQEAHIALFLNRFGRPERFHIHHGPVREILLTSDLLIAASGTVTLEAALCCVPTILIYKMSAVTYRIGRLLVKLDFAGLANLIVKREVMPELLQYDATPEHICSKALEMLDNLKYYEDRLELVRRFLGQQGASRRTAGIALQMMNNKIAAL